MNDNCKALESQFSKKSEIIKLDQLIVKISNLKVERGPMMADVLDTVRVGVGKKVKRLPFMEEFGLYFIINFKTILLKVTYFVRVIIFK